MSGKKIDKGENLIRKGKEKIEEGMGAVERVKQAKKDKKRHARQEEASNRAKDRLEGNAPLTREQQKVEQQITHVELGMLGQDIQQAQKELDADIKAASARQEQERLNNFNESLDQYLTEKDEVSIQTLFSKDSYYPPEEIKLAQQLRDLGDEKSSKLTFIQASSQIAGVNMDLVVVLTREGAEKSKLRQLLYSQLGITDQKPNPSREFFEESLNPFIYRQPIFNPLRADISSDSKKLAAIAQPAELESEQLNKQISEIESGIISLCNKAGLSEEQVQKIIGKPSIGELPEEEQRAALKRLTNAVLVRFVPFFNEADEAQFRGDLKSAVDTWKTNKKRLATIARNERIAKVADELTKSVNVYMGVISQKKPTEENIKAADKKLRDGLIALWRVAGIDESERFLLEGDESYIDSLSERVEANTDRALAKLWDNFPGKEALAKALKNAKKPVEKYAKQLESEAQQQKAREEKQVKKEGKNSPSGSPAGGESQALQQDEDISPEKNTQSEWRMVRFFQWLINYVLKKLSKKEKAAVMSETEALEAEMSKSRSKRRQSESMVIIEGSVSELPSEPEPSASPKKEKKQEKGDVLAEMKYKFKQGVLELAVHGFREQKQRCIDILRDTYGYELTGQSLTDFMGLSESTPPEKLFKLYQTIFKGMKVEGVNEELDEVDRADLGPFFPSILFTRGMIATLKNMEAEGQSLSLETFSALCQIYKSSPLVVQAFETAVTRYKNEHHIVWLPEPLLAELVRLAADVAACDAQIREMDKRQLGDDAFGSRQAFVDDLADMMVKKMGKDSRELMLQAEELPPLSPREPKIKLVDIEPVINAKVNVQKQYQANLGSVSESKTTNAIRKTIESLRTNEQAFGLYSLFCRQTAGVITGDKDTNIVLNSIAAQSSMWTEAVKVAPLLKQLLGPKRYAEINNTKSTVSVLSIADFLDEADEARAANFYELMGSLVPLSDSSEAVEKALTAIINYANANKESNLQELKALLTKDNFPLFSKVVFHPLYEKIGLNGFKVVLFNSEGKLRDKEKIEIFLEIAKGINVAEAAQWVTLYVAIEQGGGNPAELIAANPVFNKLSYKDASEIFCDAHGKLRQPEELVITLRLLSGKKPHDIKHAKLIMAFDELGLIDRQLTQEQEEPVLNGFCAKSLLQRAVLGLQHDYRTLGKPELVQKAREGLVDALVETAKGMIRAGIEKDKKSTAEDRQKTSEKLLDMLVQCGSCAPAAREELLAAIAIKLKIAPKADIKVKGSLPNLSAVSSKQAAQVQQPKSPTMWSTLFGGKSKVAAGVPLQQPTVVPSDPPPETGKLKNTGGSAGKPPTT